jgi:hypothetical protein
MLRKLLITAIVLSLVLSACGAIEAAQAFTQVGNNFMTALKDGNYETAYALFHPNLQLEVGTAADLQNMIESNAAQPEDWSFSSVNATTDADKVTTATMEGSVNYQDGKTGVVTLELVQDGDAWTIISFNLTW